MGQKKCHTIFFLPLSFVVSNMNYFFDNFVTNLHQSWFLCQFLETLLTFIEQYFEDQFTRSVVGICNWTLVKLAHCPLEILGNCLLHSFTIFNYTFHICFTRNYIMSSLMLIKLSPIYLRPKVI